MGASGEEGSGARGQEGEGGGTHESHLLFADSGMMCGEEGAI